MIQDENKILPYAKAIVTLLQSEVYSDHSQWNDILVNFKEINEYLNKIAIELVVDEHEGYAFLKQIELDDEGTTIGLIKRTPISYEVSLICIFLREEIDDFDISDSQSKICTISHQQLREHLEMFFKEKPNMKRFFDEIDSNIQKVIKLGFLKLHKDSVKSEDKIYEIKRIIKSKVSSDDIEELKTKLMTDV